MKVLMAAPFTPNGRYAGGIYTIVNGVIRQEETLCAADLHIVPFETCRIDRSSSAAAKINIGNIKNFIKLWQAVVGEVRENQPDVFYYHSSTGIALLKDLLVIKRAKKKTGIKTVLHIHFADIKQILTGKKVLADWMLKCINKYVDEVVFLSKKTREEFIQAGLTAGSNVIYNYGQIEELPAAEKDGSIVDLLFVGSLDRRKGILDLLQAVSQQEEAVRLHICGGGSDPEILQKMEEYQKQLRDKVVFHGYVKGEEKTRIFAEADVLVLPSYGEGLPLVIMEAYQAGCAVISTPVGAISEVVGEENGILVQPGDIDALSAAIKQLTQDKRLLQKMQGNNQAEAEKYSIEDFIAKIANVCKK